MEHALSSTNPEFERVRTELKVRNGWTVERMIQHCIFGSLYLVRKKKDGSTFEHLAVKAVTKKLAETGTCTNGSKVYEDHKLEVELLRMIRDKPHPNLLSIADDDIFESEVYRYIPLKYVRGGELFGMLNKKETPFGPDRARDIVSSVARGLIHLHEVIGYAHNDISLENILMEEDLCTPVVCDYGLAQKVNSPWNSNKHVSGKLPYQAPEIYSGTATVASPKADVFSLGVTLFVMLTGIPPFELPDPLHDMRYKYMQCGRMSELLKLWGLHISDEAVHLLTGMMFHNPDQRMNMHQVLEHAWFSSSSSSSSKSSLRHVEGEVKISSISSSPSSVFNFDDVYSNKKKMNSI